MSRRRATDIFSMITDPGVPALFLLGTVVLAVLGNAVYDLVMELANPARDAALTLRLALVSAGALVALLAVVAAIWLWFRLQRRRRPPDVKPAQLLEAGYAGLILFVSERADAAERTAISHHLGKQTLRQIWLIVTQEARDKTLDLIRWLRAQPGGAQVQVTQLPLADAFDLASSYDALVGALALAGQDLDQVIVDITGGTKYMSTGAVLACREYGVPMQYVRVPFERGVPITDAPARLMKVRL
jgi:hypothetical protein